MHISPSLMAAIVPMGVSAAQAVANSGKSSAEGFLALMREVVSGDPQPPSPIQVQSGHNHLEQLESPVRKFADGLRSWLRNVGVKGPISLQISVTENDEISAQASGDNARQIEAALGSDTSWIQQLEALTRQIRSDAAETDQYCNNAALSNRQCALSIELDDDFVSTQLS